MNIRLRNIGIIKDSSVAIDGITIITGKNNSGKSTFGKAVYSIVSAAENLYENATRDIVDYAEDSITNRVRANKMNMLFRGMLNYSFNNYSALKDVYNHRFPKISSIPELKEYISFISSAVEGIDLNGDEDLLKKSGLINDENLENAKNELSDDFDEVLRLIDKYSDFIEYEQRKLYHTLNAEFNKQITPVKLSDTTECQISVQTTSGNCEIEINVKNYSLSYSDNLPLSEKDNVVFFDDATIVDAIIPNKSYRNSFHFGDEDFQQYIDSSNHGIALLRKLSKKNTGIGAMVDEDRYREIEDLINTVINDDIVEKDRRYVFSSDNLELSNLATGAKAFAVIKMLLMNGSINKNTILILDEPESHLHPEWQNIFAQLVALLVKKIGIKVILASHSPNFVLAMQTYSIKYNLSEITNVYTTVRHEDGYRVDYKRVEDMTEVYADFAKFFSQIKAKFDILRYGDDDD